MPDVDIDMCSERRPEVIDYARRRYGDERVAHIITYGTMKCRAAIKDVARAQEMDDYIRVSDRISKAISMRAKTISEAVEGVEFLEAEREKYPELFRVAELVNGKPRQPGIHAAGIIITPEPLTEYMPLHFGSKSKERHLNVTQWDMYDIEEAGFLKIDFLGLNTLTIAQKAMNRVNVKREEEGLAPMTLEDIDLEDTEALRIFAEGKTTGIFQLERKYVQDFCRRMGIHCFMDVCVMNAIIRPGTMDAGTTERFIARRRGEEPVEFMHDSLAETLSSTEGILVYQEQAMQAARVFAGFSLAEADNLRKAIGKKIPEKMAEVKKKFVESAKKLGRTDEEIETVFGYIEAGQRYSFNLSHAVSYGKITLQSAWLKAHYTTEFMCELLNGELKGSGDSEVGEYVEEARYLGIRIIPPDVRTSGPLFEIRGPNEIEFGLAFIKNVSMTASKQIVRARGKYKNMSEFLLSTDFGIVRSPAIVSLINAGAMDCFGENRDEIIEKHAKLRKLVEKRRHQQKRKKDGVKLRSELSVQEIVWAEAEPVEVPEVRNMEKMLDIEFAETEAYLTESPMAPFQHEIRENTNTDIADMQDGHCTRTTKLCVAGMVTEFKEHIVKQGKNQGKEMAFLTVAYNQRSMDFVLFSDAYAALKEIIYPGRVYLFYGNKDRSFIVNDMKMLSTI
jgi:DNA polymerase-3 subunit alpha